MKSSSASAVLLLLLFAVFVVSSFAGFAGYHPGFHHVPSGVASVYRNDLRQAGVNSVAEHYGSGTGTARWNGVPGTGKYFGYHHGYGGHY